MRIHRMLWWAIVAPIVVLGVGLGLIAWSTPTVLGVFASTALTAGVLLTCQRNAMAGAAVAPSVLVRYVAGRASAVGLCMVAACVFLDVARAVALPMLALVAVSSPWTVRVVRHLAGHSCVTNESPTDEGTQAPHERPSAVGAQHEVRTLSDRELCKLWRVTFGALQETPSPPAREQIVALRQACIDELERRNPQAMGAWLASGPRAAGGPDKYLAGTDHEDRGDVA